MNRLACAVICGLLLSASWCHAELQFDRREGTVFMLSSRDARGRESGIDGLGPDATFDARAQAAMRVLSVLDAKTTEEEFSASGGFRRTMAAGADSLFGGLSLVNMSLKIREFNDKAKYILVIDDEEWRDKFGVSKLILYDPEEHSVSLDAFVEWVPSVSRMSLRIDVDPISESRTDASSRLDYALKLGYDSKDDTDPKGTFDASLEIDSFGYLVLDNENEVLNHITNMLSFEFHVFDYDIPWPDSLKTPEQRRRAVQKKILTEKLIEAFSKSKLAVLDLTVDAKTESDQGFDNVHYSVGAGIYGTHSHLRWLALPLAVLRYQPKNLSRFKPPAFYAGYDHVYRSHDEVRDSLTDDDSYSRLRFEVWWDNEMFPGAFLYSHLRNFWEISASDEVKAAGEDHLMFWEIGLKYFVWKKNGWLTVKYMTGELPGYLRKDDAISTGISFGF